MEKYNGRRVLGVSDFKYFTAYWLLCALEESCFVFSRYECLGGDPKAFSLYSQLRDYLCSLAYPVGDYGGDFNECILILESKDK